MPSKVKPLLRIVLVGAVATAGLSLSHTSSSAQSCQVLDNPKAKADELFKAWNDALVSRKPERVAARYAKDSVLLATVSNEPRLTPEEKIDYFEHFLEKEPSGQISPLGRMVFPGCNMLIDAGVYLFSYGKLKPGDQVITHARYSFTYQLENGEWLITSHHSSKMPEEEFVCQVHASTPTGTAANACPNTCSKATADWLWGDWWRTVAGGTTTTCECLRTPRRAGFSGGCKPIPTEPKG
jgi:hypothetical protein